MCINRVQLFTFNRIAIIQMKFGLIYFWFSCFWLQSKQILTERRDNEDYSMWTYTYIIFATIFDNSLNSLQNSLCIFYELLSWTLVGVCFLACTNRIFFYFQYFVSIHSLL